MYSSWGSIEQALTLPPVEVASAVLRELSGQSHDSRKVGTHHTRRGRHDAYDESAVVTGAKIADEAVARGPTSR